MTYIHGEKGREHEQRRQSPPSPLRGVNFRHPLKLRPDRRVKSFGEGPIELIVAIPSTRLRAFYPRAQVHPYAKTTHSTVQCGGLTI